MDNIRLGHAGLGVSHICLGCMSYGAAERGNHAWTLTEEESRPFFRRALKDFARRDEVVIATKVHGRMRTGPNGAGLSRKAIMMEIDASLRRLGTDHVDL